MPQVSCDAGEAPSFPSLHARACGDDVCLTPDEAVQIYVYRREVERYVERVQLCNPPRKALIGFDDAGVGQVVTDLTFPGMAVTLKWEWCGEVNGYYQPGADTLNMCREDLAVGPGFTRAVAAHEMGHAIIDQRGIAVAGSDEDAADELAAWYLTTSGNPNDLVELAYYFADHDYEPNPLFDDHSRPLRRALWFVCWQDGATSKEGLCFLKWAALVVKWNLLLGIK